MHVHSTLRALEEGGRWACLQMPNCTVNVPKVSAPLPFPPPPPALHLFTTSCPVFFCPICFVLSRPRPAPAARSLLLGGVVLSEESLQCEFCKLEHLLHRARRAAVFHCLLCLGFLEWARSVPASREDTTPVFIPVLTSTSFIQAVPSVHLK